MKKNLKPFFALGLDTSAYTTSLALVDQDENLIFDRRAPLAVKAGSLGLRQSEAVFAHLSNLPGLWRECDEMPGGAAPAAVAASTGPRPVEGSYMPVFKVSEAFGLFLSRTMGLFYLPSTHQEGHVQAGIWSAGLPAGDYLVLHLSGGTTEIILSGEKKPGCFKIELLGGTADLNAGQFIDRLGKFMGLGFPAGPELEKLAAAAGGSSLTLPLSVKNSEISFSGPASHAERLLQQGCGHAELARAIEVCIADSLAAAVENLPAGQRGWDGLLAVGGVTANAFIRARLKERLAPGNVYFAEPEYASDNAVGLAVQAARVYKYARPIAKD